MKAILKFNLPEDKEEFEVHRLGPKFCSALYKIEEHLRRIRKYEIDSKPEEVRQFFSEIDAMLLSYFPEEFNLLV